MSVRRRRRNKRSMFRFNAAKDSIAALGGTFTRASTATFHGRVDPLAFEYKPGDDWVAKGGTFSRPSTATYYDAAGVLQTVASGTLRDSHYINGVRHTLVEPPATNLLLRSAPTIAQLLASDTAYEDLPGAINGWARRLRFNPTVAVGVSQFIYQTATLANNTQYTLSLEIEMEDGAAPVVGASSDTAANFTFIIGAAPVAGADMRIVQRVANTNRYIISGTRTTGVGETQRAGFAVYFSHTRRAFRFVGWQLEAQPYATSRIVTDGATASRSADQFYFPMPLPPSELTLYYDGTELGTMYGMANNSVYLSVSTGTAPRLLLYNSAGYGGVYYDAGVANNAGGDNGAAYAAGNGRPAVGQRYEARLTLRADGIVGYTASIDGGAEGPTVSGGLRRHPIAWFTSQLWIGTFVGGSANGSNGVRLVRLFRGVRTLAECRNPSTIPAGAYVTVQDVLSGIARDAHYIGGVRHTLLEPARTNAFTHTEDFTNAFWTQVSSTIISNAHIAPDGNATADKIVEGSPTGTHGVARLGLTGTDNTLQSFSGYAKAGERTWLLIRTQIRHPTTATVYKSWVNLATGTVGTVDPNHTLRVIPLANGWHRIEVTWNIGSGAASSPFAGFYAATGDGVENYAGDLVSGIFVWGLQYEVDAPYPSSYIRAINLLQRSEETSFAGTGLGGWDTNLGGSTITADYGVAPDGTMTADRVTDGNTNSPWLLQTFTGVASTQYTLSVWIKRLAGTRIDLTIWDDVSGFRPEDVTAKLPLNQWVRVSVTRTTGTGATAFRAGIGDLSSNDRDFLVWGWQLEQAPAPTGYVRTTSSLTVTRAVDTLSFPWSHVPQVMTAYVDMIDLGIGVTGNSQFPAIFQISNSAGNNPRWNLIRNGTATAWASEHFNGVSGNGASVTIAAVVGDALQIRAALNPDGTTTAGVVRNNAAESVTVGSVPISMPAAWSAPAMFWLGSRALQGYGAGAYRSVVIARGIKSMEEMRILAQ